MHLGRAICPLILIACTASAQEHNPIDVQDTYIISLKPGVDLAKHTRMVDDAHISGGGQSFRGVLSRYSIGNFQAYAGHFNHSTVELLQNHEDVAAVQPDITLKAETKDAGERRRHGPYDRDGRDTSTYWYGRSAGAGTWVYVLDSGIDEDHTELGKGRVFLGLNVFGNTPPKDTEGHGTFMAGIIGGRRYGVAKKTNLIAVKVMHHTYTTLRFLLDGYHWAADDIIHQKRVDRAVINLSLGSTMIPMLNEAIDQAHSLGLTTVVPAGNGGGDARRSSPASARGSITVGATDRDHVRPSWSNWGPAVQMFAPGVAVCSAWVGKSPATRKTKRLTGTAVASAHVAGLIAYFKGCNNLPTADMTWSFVQNVATKGVVKNAAGGQNMFAYNLSGR
ncbi:hypothetical protein ANO11243_027530 [Dothideomycetidae sp. 11243]|nr:hypothetical protein ANO11243_027530 [fungal sp. No.11243]